VVDQLDRAIFFAPKIEPRRWVGEHAIREISHMAPAWGPFFLMLYSSEFFKIWTEPQGPEWRRNVHLCNWGWFCWL